MRYLPAVLVAAHAALIAVAYETLVARKDPGAERTAAPAATAVVSRAGSPTPLDSLSLADLATLARVEDSLVRAVQHSDRNVAALAQLASLYMLHGANNEALGPLALALQVDPSHEDLRYELRLALKLAGLDRKHVDLGERAREFAELVALAGHGC